MKRFEKNKGLTLIEIIIVLTILVVFILMAIFAYRAQLAKGRDAKRKADLSKLQNVLEDYYNDHNSYSPDLICGSDSLSPYLQKIYCDPINNSEYHYYYETDDTEGWYRIYTNLENESDPDIEEVGCSGGCGSDCEYNFGVASPNMNLEICTVCELPDVSAICDGKCYPENPCICCPAPYRFCMPSGDCCESVGEEAWKAVCEK